MSSNPFAGTPQQLFSPEDYEKMKQRQAMAQQQAVAQQAPAQPNPAIPPQATPPPVAPQQAPQQNPWQQLIALITSMFGGAAAPPSDAIVEPQKVEEVPVKDPEEREVRTMEERAKKPLADTKGVISKKTKKETKKEAKE